MLQELDISKLNGSKADALAEYEKQVRKLTRERETKESTILLAVCSTLFWLIIQILSRHRHLSGLSDRFPLVQNRDRSSVLGLKVHDRQLGCDCSIRISPVNTKIKQTLRYTARATSECQGCHRTAYDMLQELDISKLNGSKADVQLYPRIIHALRIIHARR